jgi:DNA-binding transcriptional LysR family regulator
VAMGDNVGLHVLARYASRFLECYPTGRVYLESHGPEQVYRAVLGNRAALGLVAYPRRGRNLEVVPLGEEPLVLACHPWHPLAELECIQLGALKGQRVFSFQPDPAAGRALYNVFKKQGLTRRHVIQCADIEMLKAAVKHRFEVAIVPEGSITQEVSRRTLVAVRIEGGYGRPLGVIYRKTTGPSPALRGFLALLQEPLWVPTRHWTAPARSATPSHAY